MKPKNVGWGQTVADLEHQAELFGLDSVGRGQLWKGPEQESDLISRETKPALRPHVRDACRQPDKGGGSCR